MVRSPALKGCNASYGPLAARYSWPAICRVGFRSRSRTSLALGRSHGNWYNALGVVDIHARQHLFVNCLFLDCCSRHEVLHANQAGRQSCYRSSWQHSPANLQRYVMPGEEPPSTASTVDLFCNIPERARTSNLRLRRQPLNASKSRYSLGKMTFPSQFLFANASV